MKFEKGDIVQLVTTFLTYSDDTKRYLSHDKIQHSTKYEVAECYNADDNFHFIKFVGKEYFHREENFWLVRKGLIPGTQTFNIGDKVKLDPYQSKNTESITIDRLVLDTWYTIEDISADFQYLKLKGKTYFHRIEYFHKQGQKVEELKKIWNIPIEIILA